MNRYIKTLLFLLPKISIFVLLLIWVGIFKSLVLFGESHLYEPNKIIALIEFVITTLSVGFFTVNSIKETRIFINDHPGRESVVMKPFPSSCSHTHNLDSRDELGVKNEDRGVLLP